MCGVLHSKLEPHVYVLLRAASLVKELREPIGIIRVMDTKTVR